MSARFVTKLSRALLITHTSLPLCNCLPAVQGDLPTPRSGAPSPMRERGSPGQRLSGAARTRHPYSMATGARVTPAASSVAATRSTRSSRQGAAITCTPIGSASPSVHTGTEAAGRPMNEIGWV